MEDSDVMAGQRDARHRGESRTFSVLSCLPPKCSGMLCTPSWVAQPQPICCPLQGEINGPLDITAHIHAGENVLRLIQLRDTSDHVFVVHAAIPSRVERRRFAAIDARSRQWLQFLNRVISTSESRSWPQLPASISAAMAM